MSKYETIDESVNFDGRKLYRIIALENFADVKEGDLGGFIESAENLSQKGTCWIYDNAMVYGHAKVCDYAIIYDNAKAHGNAKILESACVCEHSEVYGNATIYGNADICGDSKVYGSAEVYDNAVIGNSAEVHGRAKVYGKAKVDGYADVHGNSEIFDNAHISDDAEIMDNAHVGNNANVKNEEEILVVSNINSCPITFYKNNDNGISVYCDFFDGDIDEFEDYTEDNDCSEDYDLTIQLAKNKFKQLETN